MIRSLIVCGLLVFAMPALAQTAAEKTKAQNEIWAKEQNIYKGRAEGGLKYYLENAAPNYVGWPPQSAKPLNLTGLTGSSKDMAGQTKEKLTMELTDFTVQGDTAVIYYTNHRTMRPDGTPTDETFENIHVWTRMNGDWRVVGAMSRPAPKR